MDELKPLSMELDIEDNNKSEFDHIDCDNMHAVFFHRDVCQYILFPGWITTNVSEMLGSCIAIFLAGVLYEGIRKWRKKFLSKYVDDPTDSKQHLNTYVHAIQTCYHMIQVFMSYLLMLIFMTYNVWLCIALVLGVGFGYVIFNLKK